MRLWIWMKFGTVVGNNNGFLKHHIKFNTHWSIVIMFMLLLKYWIHHVTILFFPFFVMIDIKKRTPVHKTGCDSVRYWGEGFDQETKLATSGGSNLGYPKLVITSTSAADGDSSLAVAGPSSNKYTLQKTSMGICGDHTNTKGRDSH